MENNSSAASFWRKCSTCKKSIGLGATYWICSVSTCQKERTGFVFCSVDCCDAHIPVMNHRDAGAYERTAPTSAGASANYSISTPNVAEPVRRIVVKPAEANSGLSASAGRSQVKLETLIVVSKAKDYVRARSGMNTSDSIMDMLSDKVRLELDKAIESARGEGRKTVLDRDIK